MTFNHRTEAVAAIFRNPLARRVGMLGVATAAIAGIAVGPAAAGTSTAPVKAPTAAAWTTGAPTTTAPHTPAVTPPTPATPAGKAPATHTPAVKVPSKRTLLPHGVPAGQASLTANATQKRNVAAIVRAGTDMKLPPRAMVMAVACSLQESSLHNYGNLGNRNDHDSLGLFQQRPSSGWGTPAQVTNPHHAAQSFLKRLVKIHNWQRMPLTLAVQKVQVSAFPQAYAKWEKLAANLVAGAYAADASHTATHAAHTATTLPAPGK